MALAACATGTSGAGDDTHQQQPDAAQRPIDAPSQNIDAPVPDAMPPHNDAAPIDAPSIDARPPDARPIDAPPTPQPVTLSESTATTITAGNTVACSNNTTGYTDDNSFYRNFPLANFGITQTLTVTNVTFGIEQSTPAGATQNVDVNLETLTGTMETGTRTVLRTQTVPIGNISAVSFPVTFSPPVVVPAGSQLVVELHSPDGTTAGNIFYPGSNSAGESAPSYISAAACSVNAPATYASIGFANVQLVMSVGGTTP